MANVAPHRKKLGEAIRQYRHRAGLSLEALAEKADLHPNYLGDVERGVENISVDALVRISHVVKVTLAELMRDL